MRFTTRQVPITGWLMAGITLMALAVLGCGRGQPSSDTPVHLVPNMDDQPKYKAQGPGPFFDNNSAMREPIEGTVARGDLIDDLPIYTGRDSRGNLLKTSPVPVSAELLARGRDRFDIYCSSCHGRVGNGQGMVVKVNKGMLPPPTFHDDRLRDIEDDHMFEVITNGKGNMASYAYQVPVTDRWAIISYIRALQRSQNASREDLPTQAESNSQGNPGR